MKCFLTSSTMIPNTDKINPANGFADRLRNCLAASNRGLFICSDPDNHNTTDGFAEAVKVSFEEAGISFSRFDILDGRNSAQAGELAASADLIVLAGGHVPTQNRYFSSIGLRDILRTFTGVLVGISAGSMNSAEVVYAQPELAGEASDPAYCRFLPGLGLTERMILPHYQMIKDDVVDGLRVMEDIAYSDSLGRKIYVLVDGSYLYIGDGREELCGEAYLLSDGRMEQICGLGKTVVL